MRAELVSVSDPRWSSILGRVRHDAYHLPGYVGLSAVQDGGEPAALIVEGDGASLLLPMVIRPIKEGGRDAISPYGYPGPLVVGTDDSAFLDEALAAGIETLRSAKIVSLFVRLHPILNPTPPRVIGTLVEHGATVSIDLTLPEHELWKQMRHNHRRDVKRARSRGFNGIVDVAWSNLAGLKRLYRTTMDRRTAAAFYYFGDGYFDNFRNALGDHAHLLAAQVGDDIAAIGLFMEVDGTVEYHLSGSDERYAHWQPTKVMLEFATRWAKARGNQRLHLGGGVGGTDDSLFYFKLGFSPIRQPFRTLRVVLSESEYARLVAAHDPSADPGDLTGFFPAYRLAQGPSDENE
jgi:hypothetical protein